MNVYLENIKNLLQEISLPEEEKQLLLKQITDADKQWAITDFKLNRTEKVKKTTAILLEETIEELEQKRKAVEEQNHELEIETALERVRAIALSMKEPANMLEVCKIIAQQLELLNVKEVRNVQTAIIYETKGTYLNYEYYIKHDKLLVTEVNFKDHEIQEKFAHQMLAGAEELFTVNINGKEVQHWYAYQQTTNQFADTYLEKASSLNYYWFSLGPVALGISTYIPLNKEEINLFKRFRNVFELAYRRFLDIELAIAQAKEARIETALERVRAVAMAMRKPEELPGICETLYAELHSLGFTNMRNSMINIYNDEKATFVNYDYSDEIGRSINHLHYNIHPVIEKQIKQLRSASDAFSESVFEGKDLEDMKAFRMEIGEKDDPRINNSRALYYYFYSIDTGSIGISSFNALTEEKLEVLKRFRNVFSLSYQRYIDISLADAQTREAQIEAALERTRTQSMIMQHSKELDDTLRVFHEQVQLLGINSAFSFLWLPDEEKNKHIFWAIWEEEKNGSKVYKNKAINYPLDRNEPATKQCLIDWKGDEPVVSYAVPPEGVKNYFAAWQELIDGVEKLTPEHFAGGLYYIEAFMKYGCFGVMMETDLSEDGKKILGRIAIEFERTYTRFLDLQKAEAQAREAKIEAALERVRSRSMAMYKSTELADLSLELVKQVQALGVSSWFCAFNIYDDDPKGSLEWGSNGQGTFPQYRTPREGVFLRYYDAGQSGEIFLINEIGEKECPGHYEYLCSLPGVGDQLLKMKDNGIPFPTSQIDHVAFFKYGYIIFITYQPVPESHEIFKRFAKVFEQTYTRFLDLQKAEAQARESQIETALEKVRSRTMAMQRSDELAGTAALLFQEFKKLEQQELIQTTIGLYNVEKNEIEFRATDWVGSGEQVDKPAYGSMDEPTLLKPAVTAWRAHAKSLVLELTGDALGQWTNYRNKITGTAIATKFDSGRRIVSIAFFSKGHLSMSSPLPIPAEAVKTLERFAAVFDGTYTRFLDLQKAEAQAREAQVETALEKVRSRTLAMQKSDELAETAAVLFQQLIALGINPNRLYISIIKNKGGDSEFWLTDEDGSKVSTAFAGNMNDNASLLKMYKGWQQQQKSLVIDMQGEELQNYFRHLAGLGVPFKGGLSQIRRVQYIAYFSKGFIGMASPDEQPAETLQLLERFAAVFNLTFTRFNDLKIAEAHALRAEQDLIAIKEAKQKAEAALTELQATQKQLVQSEKMASLGELTAGIAHEIQNPLNFVNNFSEVSKELLAEMKEEMEKGNMAEVSDIMNDVIQNLEKINHHGKRADAIVKGMLQHSRSSSAVKEPTDINALCDEYLRLSYHGLRAKDKSFNATIKTDFDTSLEKINIIPQDIGRVILNLLTNAFYVVDQKKKLNISGYEPTVTVSTSRSPLPRRVAGGEVTIKVTDNGNGIPQKVLDKIFQPFFTTKPTGQGTGLGLSLSYDIVTKGHGGELKVETKEALPDDPVGRGEGTTFIITLPA